MAEGVNVAVVGASGLVGEALLATLTEREFPVAELFAVGRDDVDGETVLFAERPKRLKPLAGFDFTRCRFAFFCVPPSVATAHAERAAACGCTVIDVSAAFRANSDVPLVAAGINVPANESLLAAPSAEALQLARVLRPILQAAGLRRVEVTTTLAVSDRGRAGIAELAGQTARLLNVQGIEPKTFPAQIAFNLQWQESGPDVAAEVRRVLEQPTLAIDCAAHYAPVFYAHCQTVRIETEQPLSASAARKLLRAEPGLKLRDAAAHPTPVADSVGGEEVQIGRLRQLGDDRNGLLLWILADNVKGAAVNAVCIAEGLLKHHL